MYSLNSSAFAWSTQIDHFGRLPGYTSIAYDNRGVGHSSSPKGPYTYVTCVLAEYTTEELTRAYRTSGMAEDAIVLLDYLGWTEKHGVHIVGISLGGMIAQGIWTSIFLL